MVRISLQKAGSTLALLAAVLLTGCAAGAAQAGSAPTATAEPSSTPTPSAIPVDPLTTVTAIVARPESLELRDASDMVVAEFGYLDDVDQAIDSLTVVFGAGPSAEEHPGSSHFSPSTAHRWGAFELWERRYVDRWAEFAEQERTLYQPSFGVVLTGPDSAGVALTTEQGVVAGASWAELVAMPGLQVNPSGCSGPYLDYITREETWPDGTVHEKRFGVDFVANEDESSIARVRAPLPIHEDGCA
ncbi:hypothetical protein [Agromyces neolithicus]|uniref:Uncharacterized protein n=1 Tax=Agromyces neolithicus TaxID=269420 RepID=A0ABN2LXU4_9MICO